jgi:hypothetical protein
VVVKIKFRFDNRNSTAKANKGKTIVCASKGEREGIKGTQRETKTMSTTTLLHHKPAALTHHRSTNLLSNNLYPSISSPCKLVVQEDFEEVLEEIQEDQQYYNQRRRSILKRNRSIKIVVGGTNIHHPKPLLSPSSSMTMATSTACSSPMESASPRSLYSPSTSPIDFIFRRRPSLSKVNTSLANRSNGAGSRDGRPLSPRLERIRHRYRSKSVSFQGGNGFASPTLQSSREEDEEQEDVAAKRIRRKQSHGQFEMQRSKSTTPAVPIVHFRPLPFEVKAEMDNFFGQTKGQKRQLALRTRGEDGHVWFDGIGESGSDSESIKALLSFY